MTGAPQLNAEQMTIVDASAPETNGSLPGGRYRNPLPLSSGQMLASYTASATVHDGIRFRLHRLAKNGNGLFTAGTPLTAGIVKNVSWWSPDVALNYNGPLWELEPTEVVARTRPPAEFERIEAIEKSVLDEEHIDESMLRDWLRTNRLALIVTRNQTSRDRGDRQQPFNLRVPSGLKTVGDNGRIYDIAHYQIFQGNLVRGYGNFATGRRVLAQPIAVAKNPANPSGPPGSVKIAADGSSAAFVPANRALTWQTTDAGGTAIVRERIWVTLQPGEIRTCAGCHGENTRNQAGQPSPVNKPEALRELLRDWKQRHQPIERNGSQPLLRPLAGVQTATKPVATRANRATTGTARTRDSSATERERR
jgi:Hydrazine synthase alpha subunit middle domain